MDNTPTPQPIRHDMHMSPRTLLLIIFLALLAAFFIFLAVRPSSPGQQAKIVPTPTSVAQTTLSLEPSKPSTTGAATNSFNVVITTNTNDVTAVQVELGFDPKVLTNLTFTPGTFFPTPLQFLKQVDYNTGRISYAVGVPPQAKPVRGTGVVATISYTLVPTGTTENVTRILFFPKTLVTAKGVPQSVLKTAESFIIPLGKPTPSITAAAPTFAPLTPVASPKSTQ